MFAFGAVLYEMVTGKRAFDGKSQALLIAAIISADPEPISKLVPTLPPALDFTVARCLAKDPEQRMQTAWDLVCQLRWIAEGTEDSGAAEAQARLRRREYAMRAAFAAVMLLIVLLAIPAFLYLRGSNTPDPTRFLVNIPDMSVAVRVAGAAIQASDPQTILAANNPNLLNTSHYSPNFSYYRFAVSPDGQQFLIPQPAGSPTSRGTRGGAAPFADALAANIDSAGLSTTNEIAIVLDWPRMLKPK